MHHAQVDRLSCRHSPLHRLDSRTKLSGAIIFTVFVISLPTTSVSVLACFAVGPFAALIIGKVPLKFVIKHILIISPFVLLLALSSLFYDKTPVTTQFGPFNWTVSSGLIRFFSIYAKFIVTMAALISLVATTRFNDLLAAMAKLGVPKILVLQLGFLWRYIFMLTDKAANVLRERAGRKLRYLGIKTELKTAAAMTGTLFISSIDTAARVNTAMRGRGFTGRLHTISKMRFTKPDLIFAAAFCLYMAGLIFLMRVL